MLIGLDFDNTIVNYDSLFYKVALEKALIPATTPVNKVAVRDYLRSTGRETLWTEMQGVVYGARMEEALAYAGVIEFLQWAGRAGHKLTIVSHKTRHPILGPRYDLHSAARAWISSHLCDNGQSIISFDRIFFELTKEQKLARIARQGCDIFLDDLPEILLAEGFPLNTRRALFDPEGRHAKVDMRAALRVRSWHELAKLLGA
jgi:hypothetical protein